MIIELLEVPLKLLNVLLDNSKLFQGRFALPFFEIVFLGFTFE